MGSDVCIRFIWIRYGERSKPSLPPNNTRIITALKYTYILFYIYTQNNDEEIYLYKCRTLRRHSEYSYIRLYKRYICIWCSHAFYIIIIIIISHPPKTPIAQETWLAVALPHTVVVTACAYNISKWVIFRVDYDIYITSVFNTIDYFN